jgi:tripartite-type tricarboxylate transporter receptor subunit TctC
MLRKILLGIAAAGVMLPSIPSQAADPIADFYKGKQMRMVSGSSPGGGYDLYARMVAQHLGKYLPGNPTFIVQNMPGGGSLTSINNVAATLPQDGTVMVAPQAGAIFEQIIGNPAAQFDAGKMNWIGSLNEEISIAFMWHESKVKTFDDLMKYPSNFGTSGPNVTEQMSSMLLHMFGAKIKQVRGYQSVTQTYPAMEKGEVEGLTSLWASVKATVPYFVTEKKVNVLVQFAYTKAPDMQDVPLIMDLLTEKYLVPGLSPAEAQAIMRFMLSQQAMARPYGMGPGVPPERVAAVRKAFAEMAKDKEFLSEAEKAHRDIAFMDGDTMQKLILDAAATPKSTIAKVDVVTRPKD